MGRSSPLQNWFQESGLRDRLRFLSGNIAVFSITDLLGNFSRRLVFPYVSLYLLALGGTAEQIGLVSALAPLAGLLMFPLGGYIADHANRIRLIVASNCLAALVVLIYALTPNWQIFAAAALIQGFIVVQFPARSALIADALAPADRGKGIATMNTISSTLAIFAPYLAGAIIEGFGPNMGVRLLYGVMMTLYLTNAFINIRFLTDTSSRAETRLQFSALPGILKQTYSGIPDMLRQLPLSLKALAGVIILNFMANGVTSPFWVVYVTQEIGLSPSSWGFILLVETVLKLLMFIPAGMMVDRWGRTTSLMVALVLSLFSIPVFVFVTTFWAVMLLRGVIAVAFAIAIPACTALMADTVPRHIRGRVMSAIGQGGIMIGPAGGGTGGPAVGFLVTIPLMLSSLAGGYLYAANPTYPWFFVGFATLISIGLTARFIRDPQTAEV